MKEEKEDFFEQVPDEQPVRKKEPKQPTLRPDDPLYYEQEEDRWDHLRPSPYGRGKLIGTLLVIFLIIGIFFFIYIWFFTPQVEEAVNYGYVDTVHKEGKLFKTYEGRMIPYRTIMDTTRTYNGDFVFSIANDSVAGFLKRQEAQGRPVRVEYVIYRQRLPWRGEEKTVVLKAEPVENPRQLLPDDRR